MSRHLDQGSRPQTDGARPPDVRSTQESRQPAAEPRQQPVDARRSFGQKLEARMQQSKAERLTERLHASAERRQEQIAERGLSTDEIKSAREHIKSWKPEQVRESTQERYRELNGRMERTGKSPEQIAGTKAAYYSYRAAKVHEARTELRAALRDRDNAMRAQFSAQKSAQDSAHKPAQDSAQKSAHETAQNRTQFAAQKADAEARIKACTETLTKYAPGTRDKEQDMLRKSAYKGERKSERSNGKREALNQRPDDWREKVWSQTREKDKDAIAVTALTGARPSEVARGVQVRNSGDALHIKIDGAKVDGKLRGQATREITVSKAEAQKTTEGAHLLARVKDGQERTVKTDTPANFSARIRHASERAMPDQQKPVSAYDYRHAFSARLKADESLTSADRAAAMGQQSERSQGAYGTASQSSKAGGGRISSAGASTSTRR